MAKRCVVLKGNYEILCKKYPDCINCSFYREPEPETQSITITWRKAKAGHNFGKDTVVLYNGDPDARLVRCAVNDCIYIHVEDLLKLPKE